MDEESIFRTIPWCTALISDPTFEVVAILSREPKETTEDALFANTLRTQDTIRAALGLRKRPNKASPMRVDEFKTLVYLGNGMDGMPGVLHGGIVTTLLDEVFSCLIGSTKRLQGQAWGAGVVTASLKTDFLNPLQTPAIIVVTALLKKTEGRKWYIDGYIEDGQGKIFAKAESLWLEKKKTIQKL